MATGCVLHLQLGKALVRQKHFALVYELLLAFENAGLHLDGALQSFNCRRLRRTIVEFNLVCYSTLLDQ